MTARTSTIEDIESSKDSEYERIKQNFVLPPVGNVPEPITSTFQRQQSEFREFLTQHIAKVSLLQEQLQNGRVTSTVGDGFDHRRTIIPVPSPRLSQMSAAEPRSALEEDRFERATKPAMSATDKTLVEAHMRGLQCFLINHIENMRQLQDLYRPRGLVVATKDPQPVPTSNANQNDITNSQESDIIKAVDSNITNSILTAVLIVMFLLLIVVVNRSRHREPYSFALFFSFLALATLILTIFIARMVLRTPTDEKYDVETIKFSLQLCRQLQIIATTLFCVSVIIAMFLGTFVSVAFPSVAIVLCLAEALIVFASIHWEVSITFKNILFLCQNIRRLGTAVDFVKYTRKSSHARG